jgi:hypothetical protein
VPLVRQRPEVALFGSVSIRCIASEVLIKASFIKKMNFFLDQKLLQEHFVPLTGRGSQSQLLFLQRAALVVYASVRRLVYNFYVMHKKLSK